jgi:type IV pilus assembly protein PilE
MKIFVSPRDSSEGFTLVELMIVIMIVAILAAIAVPSYSNQIRKSRRTEARNALLDAASREERFFATNNRYSVTGTDLGYTAFPTDVGSAYYRLNVSCTVAAACTDFTFTATPKNGQEKDTACASLSLTNTGVQAATGTATAATCWN